MNDYEVLFARSARKELKALPSKLALRLLESVERLQAEPQASRLQETGRFGESLAYPQG